MTGVPSYSTTASENVNANTGITWDEGMAPATVNNSARQNMTDLRLALNDIGWFAYGNGSKTVAHTYASATTTTIATDVTAYYHPGRRIKAVGAGTGTIYGTISASSYGAPNTTITYVWDSGSLSNETLAIYAGTVPLTGFPIPAGALGTKSTAWTPVLKFGGATTGITYGTQTAKYLQIGQVTHVWGKIILTSKGSATGAATITGGPNTPAADAVLSTFGDAVTLTGQLQAKIVSGSATIFLYALGSGTAGAMQETNFTNTSEVSFYGSYLS